MFFKKFFKSKAERELDAIIDELKVNLENNYKSTAQAARVRLGERCEALYKEGRLSEEAYRRYRNIFEEYSLTMRNYHH